MSEKSSSSLSGTKRKRKSTNKSSLVNLGEGIIIEIIDSIKETDDPQELSIYLEILSKLEADIETLKKTRAGVYLRELKKSQKDSRVQLLCKNQIYEYKQLVFAEMNRKGQLNPNKRRKVTK